MNVELWHEQGCARIGTVTEEARFHVAAGRWVQDCGCPAEGTRGDPDPLDTIQDWSSTAMLRRRSPTYTDVEHPRFAQARAEEQQRRLDGWLAAIMGLPDPATRAAVSDSLTSHMIRYGEVP